MAIDLYNRFWTLLDDNWDDIFALIVKFHPVLSKDLSDFKITAGRAEEVCRDLRQSISDEYFKGFSGDFANLVSNAKENREYNILRILNETWIGMPESADVRKLRGFSILCTLCEYEPTDDVHIDSGIL